MQLSDIDVGIKKTVCDGKTVTIMVTFAEGDKRTVVPVRISTHATINGLADCFKSAADKIRKYA